MVTSNGHDNFSDFGEPGIPITLEYSANVADCKGKYGGVCNDDCRTLMVCAGQATPIYQESCEKIDSGKPYCVDSACTSTTGTNNQCSLSTSFLCTSNGIFPGDKVIFFFLLTKRNIFFFFHMQDPSDCTKYYMCPGPMKSAVALQCDQSKKFVFSMDRKLCVPKTSNALCQTINCEKNTNKFISYPKNPGYYAFCGPSIVMFKCLDDENQVFNATSNECEYNCKQAGYFIDRTSCEDYYICQRIGGKWTASKESCPTGYKFDGKGCVYAPNCKPPITPIPEETSTTDPPPSSVFF